MVCHSYGDKYKMIVERISADERELDTPRSLAGHRLIVGCTCNGLR
jgi:hypothetical protein